MDERLANDTLPLVETSSCHVRLSKDSRWPWVLLVPRRREVCELHELSAEERRHFMDTASFISGIMKQHLDCTSINVAMLGNVVSQLHCHIVARFEGDPNWPAPVWGHGQAEPYTDELMPAFALAVRAALLDRAGNQ